jgi:SNF2 family DNA or RNA helicase
MEIVENKALKLRVRNPKRITSVIPKSAIVGDNEVLVKWGLEEAQVLRNLGIKNVPSPINKDYQWPGLYKPFDHQRVTAAFMTMHRRAFCFNEQGTGKTASVIWAADYLMKLGYVRRALVLCPLSIMQSAWQADLFQCAMHRTVVVAHHRNARRRRELIQQDAEFVIMNYDGLEIVADAVIADGGFDLIIVDEANALKNPGTDRWKAFAKVLRPDSWVWLLTGTPAAQSPEDAYGLAKIVNPSGVPKFRGAFKDMVMNKITQFRWVPKPNATETVHRVLQPAIRFTKEECLDLPEMTYVTRDVPMSKQQEKYYQQMRTEMLMVAAGEEISAVNAAAKLTKLLQISCGAVYADSKEIVDFDCKDRMKVLKEVIDESSHKVLVFAPYRHSIYAIAEELKKSGYAVGVIDGGVSPGKRTELFNKFQNTPEPRVLVIQPQAASHGVTLHAANTVVYWSPVMSVETYLQANARVHRSGQKNKTTVVHLQGSSVERKLYKMLQGKVDIHEKLVGLYKEEMQDE